MNSQPEKSRDGTHWAVEMLGINKRFGETQANDDVTLRVAVGSVHGLVGENGAGKSTLMSVLYGLYAPDSGQIRLAGHAVQIRSADDAIAHGVGMGHQHFMLVETLSAIENIMLGAEPHWFLPAALEQVRSTLSALMSTTGLQVRLDQLVADLPVGERQRLEILKALYRGARLLILDEPTAVLTPQETQQLFGVLRQLRDQGTTVVLITHKLHEVMALCDQVTVMRGGRVVQELPIAKASVDALAEAMVGREVNLGRAPTNSQTPGETLLQASSLRYTDAFGVQRLRDVSLALRAGEIVGLAGVSGNGQSELLDVLAGLLAPDRGELILCGHRYAAGSWHDGAQARAHGLAHVPEDRQARALVLDFAAWESAVLGYDSLPTYCERGWMNQAAMHQATAAMMKAFDVRPPNPDLPSGQFSGGNQQKFVLARELGQQPRVLLVGQPTRGVDIGAIEFIYARLRALRDAGCAILLVSSDLDEIMSLSDRVLVMHQGALTGNLAHQDCTPARLGLLMAGGSA